MTIIHFRPTPADDGRSACQRAADDAALGRLLRTFDATIAMVMAAPAPELPAGGRGRLAVVTGDPGRYGHRGHPAFGNVARVRELRPVPDPEAGRG